ncbi:hypothetical protein [Methylorubrum podarium]|jgi:hypothetical protein|uniref:Uncharacterized protein n=1 Tax=Methylorubrum podarium TaxID=200476 RepID=A0ABV1QKM8_9HYPH|nr:hypothetical protein [Methylorubrum podarium]MDV2986977.1 hypothetical protein [Methylobacteriaceae bacterium AG10]GJE72624.1 hypothetical protein CHKEEEPN_4182 [Methylorubrum podarium]
MKNPALSLWLSSVNWWMSHATNAVRLQQRATLKEMLKPAASGTRKPRRKRITAKRRTA